MKAQTHLKLYVREIVDNWKYIDTIIFLFILVVSTGFTNPCEQCKVSSGYGDGQLVSCEERFNSIYNTDSEDLINQIEDQNINFVIDNNLSFS